VFIGSGFGEATTTDTNGYYILTQAPLGASGADRTWTVTATPSGYPPQTESVVVSSNVTSRLDFGFGQPPTALVVSATGVPDPDTVGDNLLYTVTLTNSVADAQNVLLTDTLPPGVTFVNASLSNNPAGEFTAPVLSNGLVTIAATNFSSNSAVVLLITVAPAVAGIVTNIATVTSTTPDLDKTGTNHIAIVTNTVVAPVFTYLVVSSIATPTNVMVGSNLLYTITLTNSVADAQFVRLVETLPPDVSFVSAILASNPAGEFSAPVEAGGQVTISANDFSSNSTVVLLVTVIPTDPGVLTNFVNVTSDTPNLSPTGGVYAATNTTPANLTLYADVGVFMTGAPNPVLVSNQLTYALYVTNFGPADAPAVVLTDSLPANVTFSSAVVSQGSYVQIPNGVQWNIGAMSSQSFVSASIVILPLATGQITNTATVSLTGGSSVLDTNLSNNTASNITTVTAPVLTNVSIQAGPVIFNPQTGLYQQTVQFNNLSEVTAAAVRISVLGLATNVVLYNASGTADGVPYVQYNQPVPVGSNVVFLLEYYDRTRTLTASTNFVATVVAAVTVPPPTGTYLQLDTNSPFMNEGELTIEFASVPGHTYVVQYSSDMQTWLTAAPPIVAVNTRTQWIDSGPPKTESPPGSPGQRFYRIVQTN